MKKRQKSKLSNYAKYSSIAIQMAIIIAGGTIGGYYIDRWINWKIPVFTIVLSLSSVIIAIYISIREFLNK